MAWSIFTDGGGKGTAQSWAQSLLTAIGAPTTQDNVQVVYDWEVSEGGGGKYNPLNQGPVPGHPELTSTGSQYGGGAADYASWQAGLTGATDYLNMQSYVAVKKALVAGDSNAARSAIIASPWASSHYGSGANFSRDPLPGAGASSADFNIPTPFGDIPVPTPNDVIGAFNPFSWLASMFKTDFKDLSERFALILMGALLVVIGLVRFTAAGSEMAGKAKGFVPGLNSKTGKAAGRGAVKAPVEAVKGNANAHKEAAGTVRDTVKETSAGVRNGQAKT